MELVSKVRQTMKQLINASKNLTASRDKDVFTQIAFDYSLSSISFGNQRQSALFAIQYLVSPKPESTNTAPSVTYDQIISTFDEQKSQAFKDAGLIILSYSYEQSDIVTDPVSGSVSLSFTINIQVTEKTR
ncbi:TPA: hypothetical protein N3Y92_004750 [Klebsiella pneumoniae]|uniref:hypothetical protein n=1 Tax=Enterobacteriaceae TaxID=543 RepID=UPI000E49F85D|nr:MULTISPECIES: hypothetical protein [Enterobacteriaceae]EFK6279649.1 hypothetical protein [Escherichia coli]EGE6540612.1 hypothetical protein [Escherichia coli]ELG9686739.1 hypothetical protein [Escherichia coli]MBR8629215.1 hypothetical protein [Klebsiella pneumoniae subsp. pneumoniae]MBY5082206.1 hypothetical protein [Klebsiella pneumoniae]